MAINVKAYYGTPGQGEIRRFVITPPVSYSQVAEKLAADLKSPYSLFWIDSDGDLISLGSEEDLKVATVDKGQLLRVVVKEGTMRRRKCGKITHRSRDVDCPRRQARERLQHTLPLLFPTDLLGSLLGVSSSDPLDCLLSHDSCLSDFINLWNAVAWVSKEQQGKVRREGAEEEPTATSAKATGNGEARDLTSDGESTPGDVEGEATTVTEAVVRSEGTSAEKQNEEEEPLVVDIREHSHGVDEVEEEGGRGESKPVVEEKEEVHDIRPYIRYVDEDEDDQQDGDADNAQRLHSSLARMEKMGFKDDGGWLSQLLQAKNGDVDKTLETLRAVHRALQTSAK